MAMIVKLFILGLPGSGKSTIARFILDYVNRRQVNEHNGRQWSVKRFNDYSILFDMFRRDTVGKRFKPAKLGGFDAIDLSVVDEALVALEREVDAYVASLEAGEKRLIIIEFSRNDYQKACQLFNGPFLKDTYFLYLDTALEECKQRVRNRTAHPENEDDDYPVSDYIFEKYYCKDNWMQVMDSLSNDYEVNEKYVWTFYNDHSYETACLEIEPYIEKIMSSVSQEELNGYEKPSENILPDSRIEGKGQEDFSRKEVVRGKERIVARIGF